MSSEVEEREREREGEREGEGEIVVRLAGRDVFREAEACLSIYGPVVQHLHSSMEETLPSVEDFSARITSCLARFPWLLATHPSLGIIGFAYATSHKPREGYRWAVESSVYVSPQCHRQQVGSRLYRSLFNLLTAMNYHTVLVCIGIPNERSIGFHKRLGFEEAGLFRRAGFKRGRWVDIAWLQKFLPEDGDHSSAEEPYIEDTENFIAEPIAITSVSTEDINDCIIRGNVMK